jgi:hypothetical protein
MCVDQANWTCSNEVSAHLLCLDSLRLLIKNPKLYLVVLVAFVTPDYFSSAARDLVKALLVRQQSKRLGNLSKGYLDVKNHLWFEEAAIDFRSLLRYELSAPWIPSIKDSFDSSNFDDFTKVEHEIEVAGQLTAAEQEKFSGF